MAGFWSTKDAPPPVNRDVLARSLDGYRLGVKLVVTFRRALDFEAAEAAADEIMRAAAHALGDQISQGRVPLTAHELAAAMQKRVSPATAKVTEYEVGSIEVVGARQSHQTARAVRTSVPSASAASAPPRAPTPSEAAGLGDRASGSLLAAAPRTLWLAALSQCSPGTSVNEMASSLGLALRDSTAATLLRALTMVDPAVVDRLGLFDGRAPMQELGTEICACLAAGFCRTLAADGWDADDAMRICERVSAEALGKTAPAPEQIRRYANSKAPVRDVAWLAADILGTPNDAAAIHSVMSPYCEALRVQFVAVSREMKRLTGT